MHGHGGATIDLLGSAMLPPRLQSKQGTNSKYVSTDGNDFSSTSSKVSSFSVPWTPRSEGEILPSSNLKSFSFAKLKMSTRDFCRDSVLGQGSFGSVFKGWIDEHTFAAAKPGTGMIIAVKMLSQKSFQGHKEWLAEVNYLGQLSHPHLVKLIGYCMEGERRLLVYEFMPQGSLEGHLCRRASYPLSWNLRLKVALDAAKGLAFLHSAETKVIYRDFKTSDILLDSSYNAKLSDFGLAKDGPTGNATHVSTRVLGTYGYSAPEYSATGVTHFALLLFSTNLIQFLWEIGSVSRPFNSDLRVIASYFGYPLFIPQILMYIMYSCSSDNHFHSSTDLGHLTTKCDVYSFGVVLLEMLSGRRVLEMRGSYPNLLEWAKPYLANKRKIFRILDDRIEGQCTIDGAYYAATLALRCLSKEPKFRPTMDKVVTELEQLQESEMNCSEPGR